jgi:hypothetical protein
MTATSSQPTVRHHRPRGLSGVPVEAAATGSFGGTRVMLSPVSAANGGSVTRGQRRRWLSRGRVGWLLALSLTVLLLAALAAGATAQPSAPAPVPPLAQPAPSTSLPEACYTNPLPYCFPSTTPAQPTTGNSPTTPPATAPTSTSAPSPCSNLEPEKPLPPDCIPQPTTPPPTDSGPQQPGTEDGGGDSECGISDIGACITDAINALFRSLVEAALAPILELLGHTALSTPTIDSLPGIGELWNNSFELVVAAYGLLVLVGGIVVMGHESIQTRYSIKEIGPRIPVAFLASTLSLFFTDKLIQLANALTLGVLGSDLAPSLGDTLSEAVAAIHSGGLFIILTGLVLVVVGIGLLIVYVVRVVITLILIVSGPLFLMCHALPHTDPLARWWWKAITAVLAIQVAQALVLITAVRTFLSGGVQLFGSTLSAFGMLIAAIALFYILFKIPFWLLSAVKASSGRSFLGGLARAYVAAKTFGMVAGKAGAFGGTTNATSVANTVSSACGSRTNSGHGGHGGGGQGRSGRGSADPYDRARVTTDGQYVLPLTGVHRTRPTTARTAPPRPTAATPQPRAPRGRQVALPLGDEWPENKPVLGRDGQYQLPLDVQRVTPTPPPAGASVLPGQQGPGGRRRGRPRGARQPELPFDPYEGNRANRSGQYPLPLEGVHRVPPAKPAPAPPPARSAPRARQLPLPPDVLELPRPLRKPRGKS